MQPTPSYWEKHTFYAPRDVIIVGGGIVGLTAALQFKLANPKRRVLILERAPIPLGASTRNAGFACFGSPSEVLADIEVHGLATAMELIKQRFDGFKRLKTLLVADQLDLHQCGGHEVFRSEDIQLYEKCRHQLDDLNRNTQSAIGQQLYYPCSDSRQIPGGFKHAIAIPAEAVLHPAKMIRALQRRLHDLGVEFIHAEVTDLAEAHSRVEVHSSIGTFQAQFILLATNAFTQELLPGSTVRPARNIVLVTSALEHSVINGAFHCHKGYYYFRNIGQRILLGGGRHLHADREYVDSFSVPEDLRDHLIKFLEEHILGEGIPYAIEHCWSGIMGLGERKKPEVVHHSDRILTAVGLGGMGIAIGSALGDRAQQLLSELI